MEFQTRRYGWRVELLRMIQRLVCRAANIVVAPSRWFRDIVSDWGVPADRLRSHLQRDRAYPRARGHAAPPKVDRLESGATSVGRGLRR